MSRISLFNSPLMLGFDDLDHLLDTITKGGGDGFPPYNIEQKTDRKILISLALAGFTQDDLSVTIEQSQLIIRGRLDDKSNQAVTYLHRGIAGRQFQRKFVLAHGMDVTDAWLENGLLHIELKRPEPNQSIKKIKIR